jgi:hypothetical protein
MAWARSRMPVATVIATIGAIARATSSNRRARKLLSWNTAFLDSRGGSEASIDGLSLM